MTERDEQLNPPNRLTEREDALAPPGRNPEEVAGVIDEAPLPAPPLAKDVHPQEPQPLDPDDPLLNQPLGAMIPDAPISEGIPPPGTTEPPHDPAHTGNRAEQLISGATSIVVNRSRRFSITRVAMMPGTAQANDESMGMNDFPLSPAFTISLSIRYAARAM